MVYLASYERMPRTLEDVGVKALALAHMRDAQLSVPPFIILTSAFSQHALQSIEDKAKFVLEELSMQDAAKSLQSLVRNLTLPTELISILSEAYKRLTLGNDVPTQPLALRVSRTYLTDRDAKAVLGIRTIDDLVKAVKDVWAEEFTFDALKERAEKGLGLFLTRIPLVLQHYIPPDATAFIIPTGETTYHVTAWRGVSLDKDMHKADHYTVDTEKGEIVRLLNNTTREAILYTPEEGLKDITLREDEAAQPFLTAKALSNAVHQYEQQREALHDTTLEFVTQGDRIVFITMRDTTPVRMAAEAALEDLEGRAEARSENPYETPIKPRDKAQTTPQAEEPRTDTSQSEASEAVPSSIPPSLDEARQSSPGEAPREEDTAAEPVQGEIDEAELMREIEKAVSQLEALASEAHASPESLVSSALSAEREERGEEERAPRETPGGIDPEELYETLKRLVEKYVTINPDLERVFTLFLEDVKREFQS